jgi:hypothetical protein
MSSLTFLAAQRTASFNVHQDRRVSEPWGTWTSAQRRPSVDEKLAALLEEEAQLSCKVSTVG